MNTAAVLLLFAAQAASAQSSRPPFVALGAATTVPPLQVELNGEAAEAKARFLWRLGDWTIAPSARAGELAPGGRITSSLPTTLSGSPYFGAGVQSVYHGVYESMISADVSRATLNSAKGYLDPGARAGSPAARGIETFADPVRTYSLYVDGGKIVELGGRVRAAFYAAVDGWEMWRAEGEMSQRFGLAETSVGTAVLAKAGRGEIMLNTQLRMERAARDMFNNGNKVRVASGAGGAEYAHPLGGLRAAAGVEASFQRADAGVRPYLSLGGERVAAIVAAEVRRSKDPFYPDVHGAAVGLRAAAADGVSVMVEARAERKSYEMSAKPMSDFTVSGQVAVDLGRIMRLSAGSRARAREARTAYRPADSYALNQRLSGDEYRQIFDRALRESATLEDFTARLPAGGIDDILAAVAAFTSSFGLRSYNYDAPDTPNLDDMGELYRRGRQSYLTGDHDGILICLGSAQFAANLANALGARAGVPLVASAVSVRVPDGHAVTAIRTPEYGIVFADWGRLTPTGALDTQEALAVYQALQGMPAVYHWITDGASGRHVGYLFSDEGRALVRRLTYHNEVGQSPLPSLFEDAPRGADVAAERYKALLRAPRRP